VFVLRKWIYFCKNEQEINNYVSSKTCNSLPKDLLLLLLLLLLSCSQTPVIGNYLKHVNSVYIPHTILILSSHLCFGLPTCTFHSLFRTKILYEFSIALIRATCLAHLVTLIIVTEAYKLWSSTLCSLLQPPPLPPC